MTYQLYPETNDQFLARMVLATREQHQISSSDACRLSDLAQYGNNVPTTMPEERRQASKPLQKLDKRERELITD